MVQLVHLVDCHVCAVHRNRVDGKSWGVKEHVTQHQARSRLYLMYGGEPKNTTKRELVVTAGSRYIANMHAY